jgi:ATP/ADP translocase
VKLTRKLSQFLDIEKGEAYRVGVMASLLFFLIAANNLIKIVRDSIFLSHHAVAELPYLYILVAFVAAVLIATYTKYTQSLSIVRLILATNAIILSNIIGFWLVLTFFTSGWIYYAFYVWSAIVSVIAVAQLWTLADQIFSLEQGKRSFGLLSAGGTVGGTLAGFAVNWFMPPWMQSHDLLWVIAGLYLAPSALLVSAQRRIVGKISKSELGISNTRKETRDSNIGELLGGSRYLKTIAILIFVSVIVSTLLDFQFKSAAKQVYPSAGALTIFFSSYYGWLSVATFFVQVALTGKILTTLALKPSLYVTPGTLLIGSLGTIIWPGLVTVVLTRMADGALRESIYRSGMESLYMPLSGNVKKTVKTFLDVVIERIGDATAGFIILIALSVNASSYTHIRFACVALILVWILMIALLRTRDLEPLRADLKSEGLLPADGQPAKKSSNRDQMIEES